MRFDRQKNDFGVFQHFFGRRKDVDPFFRKSFALFGHRVKSGYIGRFDDFRAEIREKALAAALMACGVESGSVVYGEIRNGGTVTVTAEVTAQRAIGVYAVNR